MKLTFPGDYYYKGASRKMDDPICVKVKVKVKAKVKVWVFSCTLYGSL